MPTSETSTADRPRLETCTSGRCAARPMSRLPANETSMETKYICAKASPFAANSAAVTVTAGPEI